MRFQLCKTNNFWRYSIYHSTCSYQYSILYLRVIKWVMCAQSCPTLCNPRIFCPWNFPGKNIGVGCNFLFQGIFLIQGLNPHLLCLLNWQVYSLPLYHLGNPKRVDFMSNVPTTKSCNYSNGVGENFERLCLWL